MAPPLSGLLRSVWVLLWLTHAVGAAMWWWLSPQGFPPMHLKFFANTAIPVVLFVVSMAGLGAALRPSVNFVASFAAFPLVFWMLLGAAWYRLCPISIGRYAPFAAPGILLLVLAWFATRRIKGGMTVLSLAATLLAAGCGIGWAFAQRGPDPSTIPYKPQVFIILNERGAQSETARRPFQLDAERGQVTVQREGVTLFVLPLLTFMSRSPDRCWSNLAPRGTKTAQRQLQGVRETTEQLTARYMDDGQSAMIVKWDDEQKLPVSIETLTGLDRPIYSHINSYCILTLKGLKEPRVIFSPCESTPVDVLPFEYPTGRPARFAYIDPADKLRVVEARSGEKGPFTDLAAGAVKPGSPLTVTFLDGEQAKFKVTLDDFTSQISRDLSPTAGWSVPQHAIEFSRDGDTITVWFTLSGTSVGRGWDTVGHGTGTYRNRVKIEAP